MLLCPGEATVSSAGPQEPSRRGGAAPPTGHQAEGQEVKQQEGEEERQSCPASQTLPQDGPTRTQQQQQNRSEPACGHMRRNLRVMETGSVQLRAD